jgi:hypothetical protein
MQKSRIIALTGTTLALVLTPMLSTAALAAASQVSVRVEGKTRTLLSSTTVATPSGSGSFKIGGAPAGTCPKSSAAGALDAATHHRWGGIYSAKYSELELTTILGEKWTFSSPNYWSVWANNRYASAGICQLSLHKGDQLLFAAVPDKGSEYPLAIDAPDHATLGHRFSVKVVGYAKGLAAPLAGAQVTGPGLNALTNRRGVVSITEKRAGTIVLHADRQGYIRAGAVRVRIAG